MHSIRTQADNALPEVRAAQMDHRWLKNKNMLIHGVIKNILTPSQNNDIIKHENNFLDIKYYIIISLKLVFKY